tara:strand:- start:62 stop:835 length:774 start_codon:yes stop_codon:yes gene_type:complete
MNEINSLLYDTIWNDISLEAITTRSKATLEDMFQRNGYKDILKGKTVLDIGCGSGRFSIAMATMGAKHVTGIDIGLEGLKVGKRIAKDNAIENITFDKVDAENLPYSDQSFDFVFSYGVLHVLKDMNKAFSELARVVKKNGNAFVFIYGSGGIYWYSRRIMKTIMKEIPLEYSKKVLKLIFLPEDRWLFLDNWYDAIEIHSKDIDMQRKFLDIGFNSIDKIDRVDKSDLHYHAINSGEEGAIMWGEGFLRYMLGKKI